MLTDKCAVPLVAAALHVVGLAGALVGGGSGMITHSQQYA